MIHRFAERAAKFFSMHVRVGIPRINGTHDGLQPTDISAERHEFIRDTSFSTVLGLVKYGFLSQHALARQPEGAIGKLVGGIKKMFSSS